MLRLAQTFEATLLAPESHFGGLDHFQRQESATVAGEPVFGHALDRFESTWESNDEHATKSIRWLQGISETP